MIKQIAFCKKDEELVERIQLYQQQNNLPSFVEAVRQLCCNALDCNVSVKINLKGDK